jgi:hypothetical protein
LKKKKQFTELLGEEKKTRQVPFGFRCAQNKRRKTIQVKTQLKILEGEPPTTKNLHFFGHY